MESGIVIFSNETAEAVNAKDTEYALFASTIKYIGSVSLCARFTTARITAAGTLASRSFDGVYILSIFWT